MKIKFAACQSIGGRENQEDAAALLTVGASFPLVENTEISGLARSELIAVLCDGMGGHALGEVASSVAVEAVEHEWKEQELSNLAPHAFLVKACNKANAAIAQIVKELPEASGMGTTLIVAYVRDGKLYWLSVGDSHLFLYRKKKLAKLNHDHSMKPVILQMAMKGIISPSEVIDHPDRNALRSAVIGEPIELLDCEHEGIQLRGGDTVILASDGLDGLPIETAMHTLRRAWFAKPEKTASQLVHEAVAVGGEGQDNTTVVLFRVT